MWESILVVRMVAVRGRRSIGNEKVLFLLASRDDACIPYQWALLLGKSGVDIDVLALTDNNGRRVLFFIKLLQIMIFNQYKAVHFNHTFPLLFVPLFRLFSPSSRLVVSYHREYSHLGFLSKVSHVIGSLFSHISVANSYATLSSVPFLIRKLSCFHVVYNGVESSEIEFANKDGGIGKEVNLACVARFVKEKNHHQLVLALAALVESEDRRSVSLNLVGGGVCFEKIRSLVDE